METKLLIIGKGDNVITMITDNLYSEGISVAIDVYNNLGLEVKNAITHDHYTINLLSEVNIDDYKAICLGVYQPNFKKIIVEKYDLENKEIQNIFYKGTCLSAMAKFGKGILINSNVSIAAHTVIEDFVSINRHVSIGHHGTVGKFSSINPGVNIGGNVHIGQGTTIGMGATIINDVKIGNNVIVGAGSLITKDVPDNVVVYGSPYKIIRENTIQ